MSAAVARYAKSVEPVYTDGRDIDIAFAELSGEAASQKSSGSSDKHIQSIAQTWEQIPHVEASDPSYYDRPMLKEPVWGWAIPTYYYAGGLSGVALSLGAAAQLGRARERERMVFLCHLIGFAGSAVCGGLLIYDLGKPARFLNMLRVFRPTSPMNVGAWILTVSGGTAAGALVLRRQRGWMRRAGTVFGYVAGVFGLALATYTGVLVANSAVPLWQQSRAVLPALFGASALTSAGSLFHVLAESRQDRRVTRLIGITGSLAELSAAVVMERKLAGVPRVVRPLRRGFGGFLWKSASILTATGLAISLLRNQDRKTRLVSGLAGAAGSLVMRFAVQHAGVMSARDARASFHQQRQAHD